MPFELQDVKKKYMPFKALENAIIKTLKLK